MPRRGYRKGISDTKLPFSNRIHTRLPVAVHEALLLDAKDRSLDAAKILRQLAVAHYTDTRLQLPQARGANAAGLRELGRIGNNLNQIAHQANLARLHLLERETRLCLAALLAAVDRL